jgi:predicted DNA-binding ribbon-helix-helix protein
MSGHITVQELERRFFPFLRKMAEEISRDFSDVIAKVRSCSIGTQTDYQGHSIGVECLFVNANSNQVDNIALSICVRHLLTTPEIDSVDVCWGHPSGHIEAELFPVAVLVDEDALGRLEGGLPELYSALRTAIARGQPLGV